MTDTWSYPDYIDAGDAHGVTVSGWCGRVEGCGLQAQGLYAARLNLAAIAKTEEAGRLFLQAVQQNLAQAHGVAAVTVGDGIPLDFNYRNARVAREGSRPSFGAYDARRADAAAAATAFVVAVLAGIPSARRAAAVQAIVAMRAE